MWWARQLRCLMFGETMTLRAGAAKKLLSSFSKHQVANKQSNWESFVRELWQEKADWRDQCRSKHFFLYPVPPRPSSTTRLPSPTVPGQQPSETSAELCGRLSSPAFCSGKGSWRQEQEGNSRGDVMGHCKALYPHVPMFIRCVHTYKCEISARLAGGEKGQLKVFKHHLLNRINMCKKNGNQKIIPNRDQAFV